MLRHNLLNNDIYSSIGYFVVISAYIEDCVENTYIRILGKPISTQSIPQLLDEINKIIASQTNSSDFHIARTKTFFQKRNQVIHGQIFGQINSSNIFLSHKRKKIVRQAISLNEYDVLINEAHYLLRKWQIIQRVKPT